MSLTLLENTLTLPGCTFHRCGMQIDGALEKEEMEGIGRSLNVIGGSALWWWGDYLCHVGVKYGETIAKAAQDSSYAPSSLSTAKWVCSNIQFSMRMEELSFTHHSEALSECGGDVQKALDWLAKAREGKWSVADMRKEIRTAGKTGDEDTSDPQVSPKDYIDDLRGWVKTGLEKATPELRAELKRELLEIAELL